MIPQVFRFDQNHHHPDQGSLLCDSSCERHVRPRAETEIDFACSNAFTTWASELPTWAMAYLDHTFVCCFDYLCFLVVILPSLRYIHVSSNRQVAGKVTVNNQDVAEFWHHWANHMPKHPAADDANKVDDGVMRIPVGLAGDDAKYTLSGSKFIVVMVSSILYKVQRDSAEHLYICFFRVQKRISTCF